MPSAFRRGVAPRSLVERIPGVGALARVVRAVASVRVGRVPVGRLALLPVAVLLDVLDAADELLLGPVGMALSFVLEAGFLLGLTGRTSYALAIPLVDLVPGVDVVPFATLTLLKAPAHEWGAPRAAAGRAEGPVIDV